MTHRVTQSLCDQTGLLQRTNEDVGVSQAAIGELDLLTEVIFRNTLILI